MELKPFYNHSKDIALSAFVHKGEYLWSVFTLKDHRGGIAFDKEQKDELQALDFKSLMSRIKNISSKEELASLGMNTVGKEKRVKNLWESTCFEVFFSESKQKKYWEINFSSSGKWNLYQFLNYRDPKVPKEEPKIKEVFFLKGKTRDLNDGKEHILFVLSLPLKNLELVNKPLDIALSAVIEFKDKEKSHYALKHSGDKPDFHRRESFICNLD